MTQQEMIEMVQQHHPEIGETQIRIWLNQALHEFCRKTQIIEDVDTSITTVANQRFYSIPSGVLEINAVDFDGYTISRLIGKPNLRDLT